MIDFAVDTFFSLFYDLFNAVLEFFYNLVFVRCRDSASTLGVRTMRSLYTIFGSDVFSFNAIYYIIGMSIIIFVIRQLIHIIRG